MNQVGYLFGLLAVSLTAHATQKPNIIYMLCDDLGYGDVHGLNPERGKIPTPNIDALSKAGMIFTDAHGGSSVCTPTRYGILTGRYAWRSRLQQGVLDGYAPPLIAKERMTVASFLKQQGYATACIGKWHLGFTVEGNGKGPANTGSVTTDGPCTRGFDHYYGFHHARTIQALITDDRVSEQLQPVDVLPALTRHGVTYIEEKARAKKPFFLYLAFNSPHTPIVPAKEWQGKSGLGDYGDFVMQTDSAVGQIVDTVDKAGIAQETLIIFTSDNGCSPAAGFQALQKQGHFPSAQFRGHKADIWDGGHRIPFIVRWPATVNPGSTCNQLICLTDFMATCAEIFSVSLPEQSGEDSFSILPLLRGENRPIRETLVHHSIHGLFAIRNKDWKLACCPGSGGWSEPKDADALKSSAPALQLYHMARDPQETQNLCAQHPDIVQCLTTQLLSIVAQGRSTPGARQTNDVTVTIDKQTKEKRKKP